MKICKGNMLSELVSPLIMMGINIYFFTIFGFHSILIYGFLFPSIAYSYLLNAYAYTSFRSSENEFSVVRNYSLFRKKRSFQKSDIKNICFSNKKLLKWGHPIITVNLKNGNSIKSHSLDLPLSVYELMITDLNNWGYKVIQLL